MQASALVYCKKAPKRVLLVSEDESLEEEIEGILSQINLPEIIHRRQDIGTNFSLLEEIKPHMLIIDTDSWSNEAIVRLARQFDPELPIVLIHQSEKAHLNYATELCEGLRYMNRDTVRFSGQIFYKSIHSYAIKNFQEQRESAQKQIEENIHGLTEIQAFWEADSHQINPSYKTVLAELESTLNYLQMLKKEIDATGNISFDS